MRDSFRRLAAVFLFGLFAAAAGPLHAADSEPLLDRSRLSVGIGISDNSVSRPNEDETGFQFILGYDLVDVNLMQGVRSTAEFGIIDFGFSRDDSGIWGSFVADGPISGNFGWQAQAGLDIGDDSGLLFGAGVYFEVNDASRIRLEYVARDDVDSWLFNFVHHL